MRNLTFLFLVLLAIAMTPQSKLTHAASIPQALPPNVKLNFTITRNEQTITHSEVQVELNHSATVIQQEARNPNRYKIEVTPSLDPSSAIHLNFRISEISDQETTLLSTPSVIVFAGDSADVSQKKAHSDELKITVTPTLLN